jgi:hypothetical protein
MPVLSNPKHEMVAQGLAKGMGQLEAYAAAGYKPNESHASRLVSTGKVRARVTELQERVAKKVEFTLADMVAQVDEDRAFARQQGQASAATAASMGKAKLLGMLVDKAEIDVRHHYDDMSEEELDRELQQVLAEGIVTAHTAH